MTGKQIDELLLAESRKTDLDPAVAARVRASIAQDTRPVRPLPAPSVLALVFFVLFTAVALGGGVTLGPDGFGLMSTSERVLIFGVLVLIAATGAWMAARSMRPAGGAAYERLLVVLGIVMPELVFLAVFRDYDASRFVPAGLICLGIGLGFSVPTMLLVWMVMKRGFVTEPVAAGTLAGLIGGLTGLSLLEVHCPLLTVPHTGVWHMAVLAVSLALGSSVAYIVSNSHDTSRREDSGVAAGKPDADR